MLAKTRYENVRLHIETNLRKAKAAKVITKAAFFCLLRTLFSRLFGCKQLGLWFVGTVQHRRNAKASIDFIHILSPRMSEKVRQFAKMVRIEYAKK